MLQKGLYFLCISFLLTSCTGSTDIEENKNVTTSQETVVAGENLEITEGTSEGFEHNFHLDAWGDNWFTMYNNAELVVEDSVSITTERSFNSESVDFMAKYPLELSFILKDFKENDSGLEYIGKNNQQMGDGGFIMQITDNDSGEVVAVSDDSMKCMVIHTAPLDTSCEKSSDTSTCGFESLEEPSDWKLASFDDSSWDSASIHPQASVSPKDGYNTIDWDKSAQFVWGPDLETNNTILCRLTVEDPNSGEAVTSENQETSIEIKEGGDATSDVFSFFPEVSVSSDNKYLYISHETGIPDHQMMVGITNWQQQVPIEQNYSGNNSWSIPANPEFSDDNLSTTENSFRGAIAVAVNGIPIFTALNNRGVDSYAIGELDEFGGHSGRADDYHYHLPPLHLEEVVGKDRPLAYALDGFPIYGETDIELDEHFGVLNDDGTYRYYTNMEESPYFIPTFKGTVNYNGDEISPQAVTKGVRPATEPLRGDLLITDFQRISDTSYSLTYQYESQRYTVDYAWNSEGEYTYMFTDPSGEKTTETYSSNRTANGGIDNQPQIRADDSSDERPPAREDRLDNEGGDRPPVKEDEKPENNSISSTSDFVEPEFVSSGNFTLTSSEVGNGETLPVDYTCDGSSSMLPLSFNNAPEATACYGVIMSHIPPDGGMKSYMVRYNIPSSVTSLGTDSESIGSWGINTVNRLAEYAPPCSKGPGEKEYTFTAYALSSCESTNKENASREEVLASFSDKVIDTAGFDVVFSR